MRLFVLLSLGIIVSLPFAFAFKAKEENISFLDYPAGSERKQIFIDYLKPIIEEKNQTLLKNREKLIRLSEKTKLNIREQRWLKHISQSYNYDSFDIDNKAHWSDLLNKVDSIPASLALAQAAKESGWGTSRFSREANNYFGQWCYTTGCGLVPKHRKQNAKHEVTKYKSVEESVFTYINNLNTNPAYKNLREIREQLRKVGQTITGYHLAEGLKHYSEGGELYIKEVQALIQNNKFDDTKVSG